MTPLAAALRDPIVLPPNRVPRFYRGGRELDPEAPSHLVKLLDAGERLPVHCHPTRAAARRLLDSRFGKTEAWIVLGTWPEEPAARVWAGFRAPVRQAERRGWIARGDAVAPLSSMVEYPVRPSDAFPGPGRRAARHRCGRLPARAPGTHRLLDRGRARGFPIDPGDASLGLGWDRAIGFFGVDPPGDLRQPAAPTTQLGGLSVTPMLAEAADPYMRALRVEVRGAMQPVPVEPAYTVGVVLEGTGELAGPTRSVPLSRGVTFALPAGAVEDARIGSPDGLEVALCMPPHPGLIPPADADDPRR